MQVGLRGVLSVSWRKHALHGAQVLRVHGLQDGAVAGDGRAGGSGSGLRGSGGSGDGGRRLRRRGLVRR